MPKLIGPMLMALVGGLLISISLLSSSSATEAGSARPYVLIVPMVAADSASGFSPATVTSTKTSVATSTPTLIGTSTPTKTATSTPTKVGSQTPTSTSTPTTASTMVSATPTPTKTSTPTATPVTPISPTATPTVTSTLTPTVTPILTPTPTATPTPTVVTCGFSPLPESATYFGSSDTYPRIVQIDIGNLNGSVGESQGLSVKVWGDGPIESVDVVLGTDHGHSQPIGLIVVSQTVSGGVYKDVWTLSYLLQDTHECVYNYTFTVRQFNGQTVTSVLSVR